MPSSLLPSLQKYLRDRHTSRRQMVRPHGFDEQMGFGDASPNLKLAKLIESPMQAIDVGECAIADNKFSYFLDGIQRSWLLYHQDFVPVYYGYVAAVVRKRQEAVMSTCDYQVKEALYLPFRYLDHNELAELRTTNLEIINTEPGSDGDNASPDADSSEDGNPRATMQPAALKQLAREAITKRRAKLEADLAKQWLLDKNKNPGWLVMDGSIRLSETAIAQPRTIGIIKSHNTQYFGFPEQEVVINLKQGQRSSTFIPDDTLPICSWYLRLREGNNQDMHFGLIRVEVARKAKKYVDEISRWIMTERRPLSLPDARWDKMIYPIRDCEQYLRSQEPSSASFGWLG
jgi:hypothetical protein